MVAPALRYCGRKLRMLVEPSVFCEPYFFSFPWACSTRHFDQSASISSAMIMGIVVRIPCPISERWQMSVTRPSSCSTT